MSKTTMPNLSAPTVPAMASAPVPVPSMGPDAVVSLARDIYARTIAAGMNRGRTAHQLAIESLDAAEAFCQVAAEKKG